MFRRLQRSAENLKRAALDKKFAYRIAGGIATGIVIGVLPKDSALPYAFALIAMLLPFSLVATIVSAILCSFVSPLLDTTWDQVGYLILTAPGFQSLGSLLESVPVSAWTRFNNSIVMGTLVCSLAAWLPCFAITHFTISRMQTIAQRNQTRVSGIRTTEIEG